MANVLSITAQIYGELVPINTGVVLFALAASIAWITLPRRTTAYFQVSASTRRPKRPDRGWGLAAYPTNLPFRDSNSSRVR